MNTLEFCFGGSKYPVYVAREWKSVTELISAENTVILSDTNICNIYGNEFPDCPVITIGDGETIKNISTVEDILKHLLLIGADRSTFLLAIGGGLLCDIAGFVASIYMRGIEFGFVSTSLLSQVDASIGAKNGINLGGIKNMIGCFNHPDFVICDQTMLKTLDRDEFISGLGEIVKYALIKNHEMLGYIEENIDSILNRDLDVIEKLVLTSINIKSAIVGSDSREKGERRLLNFGHTTGHAIEAVSGMKHGFAIAHGMIVASEISYEEGLLNLQELGRIKSVLSRLNLLRSLKINKEKLKEYIIQDKKKSGQSINFILIDGIGNAIEREYSFSRLMDFIPDNGIRYEA